MRTRFSKVILIGVIALGLLMFTGCGTLETLIKKNGSSSPIADWIGEKTGASQASVPATNLGGGEDKTIVLYFADSSGKYLVKEERTIPKTLSLAKETVNQWLKGPVAQVVNIQPAVSPETSLLGISINGDVATVDLSKEFTIPYGKVSQEVTLYGLVNTLTQFPTIKEVKIRVEGKPLTKLGSIDTSKLVAKAGLVKGTEVKPDASTPASKNTNNNIKNPSGKALPDSPSSINLFSFPPSST